MVSAPGGGEGETASAGPRPSRRRRDFVGPSPRREGSYVTSSVVCYFSLRPQYCAVERDKRCAVCVRAVMVGCWPLGARREQ